MLFEPNSGGHHAGYVAHILDVWRQAAVEGTLVAAVSPRLFDEHPQLRERATNDGACRVEFVEMHEAASLPKRSLLRKGLAERTLLKRYVERLRPRQVLAMFGDHTQFALATGVRWMFPVEVSLLLLRVSHHRPPQNAEALRAKVTRLRKQIVLRAAIGNRHFGSAFSADPSAVAAIHQLAPEARAFVVPDPVTLPSRPAPADITKAAYGADPDRVVLLLFGVQAERKGVIKTLEALRSLPPETARRLCLLMAGPVDEEFREALSAELSGMQAASPVQVVLRDTYLDEAEINDIMAASDLVLVPYQLHAGTSSVLIRAAGSRRPVLSQRYGLMGEQVQEYELGQTVDARRPDAIAEGITQFLRTPHTGFNRERARAFAETQTPEAYARALLAHLGLLPDHVLL